MEVQQHNLETKGHFFITHDDQEIASMHYVWAGDQKMIIDHTEVAEAYESRGLGKQLLSAVVTFARQHDIKIIPLCPFAKAVFDKQDIYKDVLA